MKPKTLGLAPIEKLRHGVSVCGARVFVADVGGEEFDEPPRGGFTSAGNGRRKPLKTGTAQLTARNWNNGEGQTGWGLIMDGTVGESQRLAHNVLYATVSIRPELNQVKTVFHTVDQRQRFRLKMFYTRMMGW